MSDLSKVQKYFEEVTPDAALRAAIMLQKKEAADAHKIEAPPRDPRFLSTTDHARNCWTQFNEYVRCVARHGEDHQRCVQKKMAGNVMCPNTWLDKYTESQDDGEWFGYGANDSSSHH